MRLMTCQPSIAREENGLLYGGTADFWRMRVCFSCPSSTKAHARPNPKLPNPPPPKLKCLLRPRPLPRVTHFDVSFDSPVISATRTAKFRAEIPPPSTHRPMEPIAAAQGIHGSVSFPSSGCCGQGSANSPSSACCRRPGLWR